MFLMVCGCLRDANVKVLESAQITTAAKFWTKLNWLNGHVFGVALDSYIISYSILVSDWRNTVD